MHPVIPSRRVWLAAVLALLLLPGAPVAAASAAAPAATSEALLSRYLELMERTPQTQMELTSAQRAKLWQAAYVHPVAGMDDPAKLQRYDPTGIIGFCFGRSMAVHLLARGMGLAEGSIRALFVAGDLRSGDKPEWRFHVTTLVRGSDGDWHAVDPIMGGSLSIPEWVETVRRGWDKPRKARFYLAPASAVVPDIRVVMDSPQRETGERLIDLSFDPTSRPGFTPALGGLAHELDAAAVRRHFMSAGAQPLVFDFTGVTINSDHYVYNGYFEDLLRAGVQPPAPIPTKLRSSAPAAAESFGSTERPLPLGLNFGAMRRQP